MEKETVNSCMHVYGVALDRIHAGKLLTLEFLQDGKRPGVEDGLTAHKEKSALAWTEPENAALFNYCPICGQKIETAAPGGFITILGNLDKSTPRHVQKLQTIAADAIRYNMTQAAESVKPFEQLEAAERETWSK